jgi:hypothetical protein
MFQKNQQENKEEDKYLFLLICDIFFVLILIKHRDLHHKKSNLVGDSVGESVYYQYYE